MATDAGTEARDLLEDLIDRISGRVRERLEGLTLPAPAYAVALVPADDLYPFAVCVGLEPDRERALASLAPVIAFSVVWQNYEFAIQEFPDEDDEINARVAAVESRFEGPEAVDGMDAWTYVLGNVARRLTADAPVSPVTEDFVVFFCFAGDIDDLLLENLRSSISPQTAERLRAKGLHPDDWRGN